MTLIWRIIYKIMHGFYFCLLWITHITSPKFFLVYFTTLSVSQAI
jgi:hypothetical protein